MTSNDSMDYPGAAALPYMEPDGTHTIGHSGTDTSQERAIRESRGQASARQRRVITGLRVRGAVGITVKQLREETGWHHGTASGLLSNLDKAGKVVMLDERRDGCHVYVLPQDATGRRLAERRPQAGVATATKYLQALQEAREAALAMLAKSTESGLDPAYQDGLAEAGERMLRVLNDALGLSNV